MSELDILDRDISPLAQEHDGTHCGLINQMANTETAFGRSFVLAGRILATGWSRSQFRTLVVPERSKRHDPQVLF